MPKYNWTYPAYVAFYRKNSIYSDISFSIMVYLQTYYPIHVLVVQPNRLVTIARQEGVRALWKGFVPKVLRLAPGGGVLLLVVEVVSEGFRKCKSRALANKRLSSPDPNSTTVLGPPYI